MADSSVLRLSVLGNLEIYHEDKPLKGFVSAKVQALLCYLVLTARAHTRDALVGLFWGDMPDADAKTNLRQAIANLRRLLEPHLLIDRETVAFNRAAPYWLDAEEFAKIADFRSQIADNDKSAISNLKSAIELYRGDFLDGFHVRDAPEFEEWVLAQRERLREQALRVLHILTTHHTTHGEYAGGIDYAQQLLALDPWREEAHRELMLLYARTGQRSAALAQFETCRRVLQEQMGVEPDAATVALAERIHAARSAPPHNLPAQPTSFVGRAGDIAQIESRLLKRECRMLTLVGLGGIGKTRLALQSAEHLANIGAFLDGVFFAPLASINADSTDALVFALADACGLTLKSGDPQLQLCDYLRDKEILFVLDNFEHLLAHVGFLTQLLKRGRDVKLLVTSRERLNVQWEWLFEIAGLTAEPSAQLFSERACQVEPRFLLAENQAHVARICQLVQGMPLGIELASAWVKAHACADIAREIERTFDFLATTMRDAPDRQRSLRAVFDYSWQRVSAEEQRVFRALSVFRGGFTREAAGQVAGATVSALAALVNKSLVRHSANERYEMHEAVRQFAQEKLAQAGEEADRVMNSHIGYYAEFLHQRTEDARGAKKKEVLDEIEAEIANIRAAWHSAIANRKWQMIDRTLECLYIFYDIRSRFKEGQETFGAAARGLTDANDVTDKANRVLAKVLLRQAIFQIRDDDLAHAKESALAGLSIAQRLDASQEIALAYNCLGNIAWSHGDYREARKWHLEKLAIDTKEDNPWKISVTLNNLGIIANAQGDLEEASRLFEESIALKKKIGDRRGLAMTLDNFGIVLTNQGNYAASFQCRQEAVTILREIGDKDGLARALNNLGLTLRKQGNYVDAKPFLHESLAISQEIGNREMMTFAQINLGAVACGLSDFAQAENYFRTALKRAMEIQAVPIALSALVEMANLLAKQDTRERAFKLLAFALHHPATTLEAKKYAESLCAELTAQRPSGTTREAQEQGRALTLEQAIALALQER